MTPATGVEDLLRDLAPRVLGTLTRRHGQFDACEDATQEALLAAATQWSADGIPDNPRAWLLTVASRRLVDQWRSEQARRRREETAAVLTPPGELTAPAADAASPDQDDTLTLLFLCCHPALSPASQLALTLRAVGGLTTAQIAALSWCRRRRWRSGSAGPSSGSRPVAPRSGCRRPRSERTGSRWFSTSCT